MEPSWTVRRHQLTICVPSWTEGKQLTICVPLGRERKRQNGQEDKGTALIHRFRQGSSAFPRRRSRRSNPEAMAPAILILGFSLLSGARLMLLGARSMA